MRFVVPFLLFLLSASPLGAQPAGAIGSVVDSLHAAAERALADGRPWKATRTIAPLLETPITRTPITLLTAARAAAGWEGWATVIRLLMGQSWLDVESEGEGRALLARAMVERGDPGAADHARFAVLVAVSAERRGERLVTLGRAHDRAGRYDSAGVAYLRAAANLPAVADWLKLRAAGVLADSGSRSALYAQVRTPAAQSRIPWTEALARERTSDFAAAARIYDQIGARLSAIRLRIALAGDNASRRQLRRELVKLLPQLPIADVGAAVDLLDRSFAPLPLTDEIVAARRAAAAGELQRAARGFARSGGPGIITDGDRITYGTVLARLGRHREAIGQFDRVRDRSRRAEARYHRARSLFRVAGEAQGLAALRRVRDSFPNDSIWAATAGWLVADALVDDGADSLALGQFHAVARRFPATIHGDRSAFQAALITYLQGQYVVAAKLFEAVTDSRPGSGESTAGWYWAGRAWESAGDTARARGRWGQLVTRFPQSYYAVPASRRLGVPAWTSVPGKALSGSDTSLSEGLLRAERLRQLGLDFESRQEFDRLQRMPGSSAALLETGRALLGEGHAARALRLAQRAVDRGAGYDDELLRLLYPLPAREVLEDEARAVSLPPFLIAGLIRQESLFDPAARSRADARGLMQVLPSVGAVYARREGLPEWDPVLLYQPDVNLHFGLLHFAERQQACGGLLESALAAYNAGPTPVNRWLTRAGTSDPEVFLERIPYVETRDYVRRVLYNQARYESLYGPQP
ncbi:MAG TPA: transglycosylase SLT domain-containing protein [Gemmatimonadales bacterium]